MDKQIRPAYQQTGFCMIGPSVMTELPGSFVSEQLIRPDLLEMTY